MRRLRRNEGSCDDEINETVAGAFLFPVKEAARQARVVRRMATGQTLSMPLATKSFRPILQKMAPAAFHIVYDVSRDWKQILVPILLTTGWMLGFIVGLRLIRSQREKIGGRFFVFLWLALWLVIGGLGLGNVWYQRFRCIRELNSGDFLVAEGPITFFRPEVEKASEKFTVGNESFEYYSANLGGGGMRYSGGANGPLHLGTYVRVTYDRDRRVLRLEVGQPIK